MFYETDFRFIPNEGAAAWLSTRDKIGSGKKHLLDQRLRIEQSTGLDNDAGLSVALKLADEILVSLREMEETLARMLAEIRRGQDSSM